MNDPTTKSGTLVWVEMVAAKFALSHATNRMDEVGAVQIFEPVLVRVMSVGLAVKVVGRRILPTLLVTCILQPNQHTCNDECQEDLRGIPPR